MIDFEGIFNHINNGILLIDADLKIHFVNQWMQIYHEGDLQLGDQLDQVFNMSDQEQSKLKRRVKTVLALQSPSFVSAEHDHYLLPMKNTKLLNPKFKLMQQEVSMIPYGAEHSLVLMMIYDQTALMISRQEILEKSRVLAHSLDDLQKAHERLQEQTAIIEYKTNYDTLTGLPNRTLFKDRAINAVNQAIASNKQLALIHIDINRFRLINDTYGSDVGDALLIAFGKMLSSVVSAPNTVARLASDEFLVLKTQFAELDEVAELVEEIHDRLQEPWIIHDLSIYVSVSMGISIFPDDTQDLEQLSTYADLAMEKAKKELVVDYRFYTEDLNSQLHEVLLLETELKRAIVEEQLEVYYQPKFRVEDGIALHYGAEALIRWMHPTMGRVFPDQFIPIAEHIGLITDITFFVVKETLRLQRNLIDSGMRQVISINIAPQDIESENFCQRLYALMTEYQIPPELIELEITERTALEQSESSYAVLKALREYGFSISLDDFGTGFSSLSYLAKMPVDVLKIDKSFIDQYGLSDRHNKFLKQIIELASVFDMTTIAEGVEDVEVIKQLVEFNCTHFQGYYFSQPLGMNQFVDFCFNEVEGRALNGL